MQNPLKRKPKPYTAERDRLLEVISHLDPKTDEYHTVLTRINEIDKINNRSTEFVKTVIPTIGTIGSVAGIYALQQFAGVIIPKALDSIASRSSQKNHNDLD